MSAHSSPAATFINIAILAGQKAIANVSPAVGVHVVVLNALDDADARCLGCAGGSLGMVNNYIRNRCGHSRGRRWTTGAPLSSAYNSFLKK
jgi:hypothetical protein